jgi:hypothetical protein
MRVKSCCVITKSSGWSAWTRSAKWTAIIMCTDGPRGSCRKKMFNCQDFHRRLTAVCGQKALVGSTMFNCVRSFYSGKDTAVAAVCEWRRDTALECFVKPSRSSQGDDSDVWRRRECGELAFSLKILQLLQMSSDPRTVCCSARYINLRKCSELWIQNISCVRFLNVYTVRKIRNC